MAETLDELQAQVDAFDHIYNTERPHQGLPGRVTPSTAWHATPKAQAPRPKPNPPFFVRPAITRPKPVPADLPRDTRVRKLTTAGTFNLAGVNYKVDGRRALEKVLVTTDGDKITVADLHGEILIEHTRPPPGARDVGNGNSPRPATQDPESVTEVLRQTHQPHRSPDTQPSPMS